MEPIEVAVRCVGISYFLSIVILVAELQVYDINIIMLVTVFTMVFTCPCFWALIRCMRAWDARRRIVVVEEPKAKKKPDIALPKDKAVQKTQAQILAEQRNKVQKIHNVGAAKTKKALKPPKRQTAAKKG